MYTLENFFCVDLWWSYLFKQVPRFTCYDHSLKPWKFANTRASQISCVNFIRTYDSNILWDKIESLKLEITVLKLPETVIDRSTLVSA